MDPFKTKKKKKLMGSATKAKGHNTAPKAKQDRNGAPNAKKLTAADKNPLAGKRKGPNSAANKGLSTLLKKKRPGEHSRLRVACPSCGRGNLHVEHELLVAVDIDLAGPTGRLGWICPLLTLRDAGELDERGDITWRRVGELVEAPAAAAEVEDGTLVAPVGRTVGAHSAEVHDSSIVLSCACGWREEEDNAPAELRAVFQHIRNTASPYVGSEGVEEAAPPRV